MFHLKVRLLIRDKIKFRKWRPRLQSGVKTFRSISPPSATTFLIMASYYDEVEVRSSHSKLNQVTLITKQIEDMEFDEENLLFHSPCPCGDRFEISLVRSNLVIYRLPVTNCGAQTQLQEGEDIARCPSCSLIIRVIYDPVSWFLSRWHADGEGWFCRRWEGRWEGD